MLQSWQFLAFKFTFMLSNFITLFLILTPLFIGFLLPISTRFVPLVNLALEKIVFVILLFIGLSLSQVQNIGTQVGFILFNVIVLAVLTMGSGLLALMAFDKLYPWQRPLAAHSSPQKVSIKGSLIQLSCVGLGFVLGKLLPLVHLPIDTVIKALLMLLVLLVGISLSHAGMTLREVLLNKRGVQMSVIFCASVALSGVIFGLLMPEVSVMQGLALSSGYGWYSLSGIIMTDRYGAVWGSVALMNDLLREFCTLLFVPLFMHRFPSAAVGLGGVTVMDFTLPVVQSSGGNAVVPLAMSFGFIVNIIAPILMVFFASF